LNVKRTSGNYENDLEGDKLEATNNLIWSNALFMASQGLKVFPLRKGSKEPLLIGWQEEATDNEVAILGWGQSYPDNNYGILTGQEFFVLDFDLDELDDIDLEIQKVQEKLGPFEVGTLIKTGRGYHLYCSADGFDIRSNSQKRLTDKVDIKGAGSYVVGPGSIHPNGQRYEFVDPCAFQDGIRLTKLSHAALHYIVSLQGTQRAIGADDETCLRGTNSSENRVSGGALDYAKPIPKGERNNTLFRIGCYHREVHALEPHEIYQILRGISETECEIPLPDYELKTIAESCSEYPPGEPRNEIVQSEPDEQLSKEAQDLFQGNELIELVRRNVQKFHVGDWNIAELLMLSVASQSVINCAGIQPKLSGESGKGKTHVSQAVLHLLDPSMYRAASFSSKALFYDDTLKPKTVIFSDDVNLNPDVDEIVRAAMSNWEQPTQRMTLDSKRNPITLSLPPRISFWFTSVNTTSTLQLVNRQVEVNVDESPDQDRRVEEHQRRLAKLGLPEFYEDDDVQLLRQAFLHLNKIDFVVKIPFMDNIVFVDTSNRRNLLIFEDLIKAYCVLNYQSRGVDDDGALIATREDFDNALKLFKTVAVQQISKLNDKERQVAALVEKKPLCDQHDIMNETGLHQSRIHEIIHGRKDSANRGLMEKIGLTCYFRNETDPETGERWGRNRYELRGNWSVADLTQRLVYWKDEVDEDEDQLRTVSDYIAEEERNSEHDAEWLFSRLEGGSRDIVHSTNSNFATSEEYETMNRPPSGCLVAPQRSPEIARNDQWNGPTADSKPETDAQNALRSISETRSEVERTYSEVNEADYLKKADPSKHRSGQNKADEAGSELSVVYVEVKMLDDVSSFIGSDLMPYSLRKGEVARVPDDIADVLYKRGKAIRLDKESK
jgi:hypothetical protein